MATIQPVSHLSPVATCRQTVEAYLAPPDLPRAAIHRLAADGYDLTRKPPVARSHLSPVATCRQTVEAALAPPTTAWQPMAT
jgi:hypothetical protein